MGIFYLFIFFFAKLPNFEMFALKFTDVKLTTGLQGDMPCQITGAFFLIDKESPISFHRLCILKANTHK